MNPYCFALSVQPPAPSPPASIAATNDIRGIKPPVPIPNYEFWITCVLVALLLALALYLWWRHRQKQPAKPKVVEVVPPHIRARQKL